MQGKNHFSQKRAKIQRVRMPGLRLTTLALCMLPSLGFALGLGEIRSNSNLGEPLEAEINLVNLPAHIQADNLRVRSLQGEEARALGVDIVANWQQIDFRFNPENSSYQIQLNSRKPVREPYVNLLVEVVWPSGKLYREYTVFLDPAPLAQRRKAASKSTQQVASQPTPDNPRRAYLTADAPVGVESLYNVQPGDTLSGIAARLAKSTGDYQRDWESWLFEHNHHAFIHNNRHQLMAGVNLQLPAVHDEKLRIARTEPSEPQDQRIEQGRSAIAEQVAENQQQIDTLAAENQRLQQRVTRVENADYLETLQTTLALQNQLLEQLQQQLADSRELASPTRASHAPEAPPVIPNAGTGPLLAVTPIERTGHNYQRTWSLLFAGGALMLLMGYSLAGRFRPRSAYGPIFGTPLNKLQRKPNETATSLDSAQEDDIDERLLELKLKRSVKARLKKELATDAPPTQWYQTEKDARDQLVQRDIQGKVDRYNRQDHSKPRDDIEIVEEIPIDPEMEAYLKL